MALRLTARDRRRIVTDEPHRVAPHLLGLPLATIRRRTAAMAVDLLLAGLLVLAGVLGLTLGSIERDQPGFLDAVTERFRTEDEPRRTELDRRWARALILYMAERRPEALPDSVRAALANGDPGPVDGYVETVRAAETFGIALNEQERPLIDAEQHALALDFSAVGGTWYRLLGAGFGLVGYFTLAGWAMRGRSPGKALLGIRVVRLDGKPFSLWTSWGRAGGYGASLGTAGLGFLEAIWHPNRQAVHDRIAGTVVVRTRGRRRRRRGTEETAGRAADEAGAAAAGSRPPTGSDTPAR